MNDLITVNYNSEQPTVLGRDLHKALEVKTAYKDWFPRMCEYGFAEGTDYSSFLSDRSDGKAGKPRTDHQLMPHIPGHKYLVCDKCDYEYNVSKYDNWGEIYFCPKCRGRKSNEQRTFHRA